MKPMPMLRAAFVTLVLLPYAGAQQEIQQKMVMIKEAVEQNRALLRQYTWSEQSNIFLKGDLKKTIDYQCQYGPDGQVQKTVTGGSPQSQPSGGRLKQRVIEKKKDELQDYMEQAGALIKEYVPPNPQQMKASFESGNASLGHAAEPDALQMTFKNYIKPGDSLVLTFNSATKALTQVNVNSYMNDQKDAVTLQANFQSLPGGPNYVAETVLNAPAKNIRVQTTSSNYQRMGQ